MFHNTELEDWAKRLGPTVVLSFIFVCLVVGKGIHAFLVTRRTCGLVVPPSLCAGFFGLCLFGIAHSFESNMANSLQSSLANVQDTLLNFCFTGLVLGLYCSGTRLKNVKQVVTTILAEGMPMLIYTQIVTWGQTALCLFIVALFNIGGTKRIPTLYGILVPAGLEQGTDLLLDSTTIASSPFITTVLEEAQSLGLICTCIVSVFVISFRPWLVSRGIINTQASKYLMQGSGNAEAFLRGGGKSPRPGVYGGLTAAESLSELVRPSETKDNGSSASSFEGDKDKEKNSNGGVGMPGLGMHLALVALPSFFSFLLVLCYHLIEVEYTGTLSNTFFGVRLFKVSMVMALSALLVLHRRTPFSDSKRGGFDSLGFKRDVFLLLCGLFLDLTFIAALSGSYPRPHRATHYFAVGCLVLVCLMYSGVCFVWLGRALFPNYSFERSLIVSASVSGNVFSGLFMARVLDPTLVSPVVGGYCSSLMMFFIPGTTVKNKVMLKLLTDHESILLALLVAGCITWVWIISFQLYAESGPFNLPTKSPRVGAVEEGSMNPLLGTSTSSSSIQSLDSPFRRGKSRRDARAANSSSGSSGTATTPSGPTSRASSLDEEEDIVVSPGVVEDTAVAAGARAVLSENSEICSNHQVHMVASWLPSGKRSRRWQLRYSLLRHGASLDSLLWACGRDEGSHSHNTVGFVLLIEDSRSCVFGAFLSHSINTCSSYGITGSGESFVFRLGDSDGSRAAQAYRWTGNNDCFYLCNTQQGLCIGGGGEGGCAIQLDDELDGGVSTHSDVYNNEILASSEFFKTLNVELYELTDFV